MLRLRARRWSAAALVARRQLSSNVRFPADAPSLAAWCAPNGAQLGSFPGAGEGSSALGAHDAVELVLPHVQPALFGEGKGQARRFVAEMDAFTAAARADGRSSVWLRLPLTRCGLAEFAVIA